MADDEPEAMRERVLEAVRRFPGIHFRALVRELDTSTALARYHLEALLDAGEVRSHDVGGYTRYFPREVDRELTEEERGVLEVLRQTRPLEIALALLEFGALQHKDLVEITGLSKGTVTYHLNKLRDADVVRPVAPEQGRGVRLRDPEQVREILRQFTPAPEMLERVHDLWDDLFGGHRGSGE